MIRELFCVGLGGAIGCMARHALSTWMLGGHLLFGFPLGTFTVNAVGSLVIGFLLQTLNSSTWGWLLVTGLCGGFTTFSTFSTDTVRLLRAGDYTPAVCYVVLSIAVCLLFTALGMLLGSQTRTA